MVVDQHGVPGAHPGLSPPQPLVSTMVGSPPPPPSGRRAPRGAPPALVEVGARAEHERVAVGALDPDRADGADVPGTAGAANPGTSSAGSSATVSPQVRGATPARAEHQGDVVALTPVACAM